MTGRLSDVERAAAGLTAPSPLITGIVDVHHDDGRFDLPTAKAAGLVALIHKATEGGDFVDKGFEAAMAKCAEHGLLRGAYHYANGKTAVATQADNFLRRVAAYPDALLALDLEDNARSSFGTMTVTQGVEFVRRVHDARGRWPLFYTFTSMLNAIMRHATDAEREVLSHCPLWVAQYGERPTKFPAPWADCALWQYTDGPKWGPANKALYPRTTAGFGDPVQDRSAFRGTPAELAAWWASAGR